MSFLLLSLIAVQSATYSLQIDPLLAGINRKHCSDYPHISIHLSAYSPDLGFVIYYEENMFALEKPKTTLHYPKVKKVNPVRFVNESYYPFNAIVRVGEFMKTYPKYYALRFNKNDPEKILRHYEMYYLSAAPKEIHQVQMRQTFLNIEQLQKVTSVIAALVIPTSGNDFYSGLIYNVTEDNKNVTEIKFKVNGNVLVAKNSIETNSSDNRMVTLDIFDFIERQTAIGYRSYGFSFRYFSGTDTLPSIIGNSAWFDNQVLIGCPPTQCYSGEIDAGTIATDDKLHIFTSFYHWTLPSKQKVFPASKMATYISDIPIVGLGPSIRFPIHAAFARKNKTYLFASNNRLWISSNNFTSFTESYVHEVFPEFPPTFWQSNIDATFTNDETNMLFILKDSSYYVLNLDDLTFDDRYINSFPLGERSYPRPLSDFVLLPEQIDAAITMKTGETYIFYAEFVFVIKQWDKESGRPKERPTVELMQDMLFDCSKYDYSKTEYKTKAEHDVFVNKDAIQAAITTDIWTVRNVVELSSMVIGGMVALILVVVAFACAYERKNLRDRQNEYDEKHRSVSTKRDLSHIKY